MTARPLPVGFEPYVWARTVEEVAEAHGLPLAQVLRFDANVASLPGVPAIPSGFVNQDSCAAGSLCAPCNNPLAPPNAPEKAFTGACVDPNQAPPTVAAGGAP